jgi:penicillin-binding protein 1A
MKVAGYILLTLFSLGFLGLIVVSGTIAWAISHYGENLPDYHTLKDYEPPLVARVHAGDGRLMAEFAKERRIFVPIEMIPEHVKQAFISAEDKSFYTHDGLDYKGIVRAALTNVKNLGKGRRLVGASTITQQVAKNFLLTNEVSYERKIKEAILAHRMEKAISKDKILELYLNDIFLGQRAYGVAAAALTYFGKDLASLSIEEVAYLASLPKAPNNYHPIKQKDRALARRNWVIGRMKEDGYINSLEAETAQKQPLDTLIGQKEILENIEQRVQAPYFAEEIRRFLIEKYGEEGLFKMGLTVRTSLDPEYQAIAERVFRDGLLAYDIRHGYRGPVMHVETMDNWKDVLKNHGRPIGMLKEWKLAIVLSAKSASVTIGFQDGSKGIIPLSNLKWAAKHLGKGKKGPAPTSAKQVLKTGDVIFAFAEKDAKDPSDKLTIDELPVYRLRQIPKVNGGMVVMDPHTGRVLAMQGGWAYGNSEFNRATQALRQPGSAFKPFVYLSALENGFTPSTLVLDAPFVLDQGPGKPKWRPTNYSHEYYGPTPIRVGIEKSRNLMTVRLAHHLGMERIANTAKRFGIHEDLPLFLANSLGAMESKIIDMAAAYAVLVNGGKDVNPVFIDRIQTRNGQTIYRFDDRLCGDCGPSEAWQDGLRVPALPDNRAQITDPRNAYQIVSILEGVVQRGTGVRLRSLNLPLAGKTGTTNDSKDSWFMGFTPDLVIGVYVGFDKPETLGRKETGSSVALPIFKSFVEEALADVPPVPFRIPPGISLVQVNAENGVRAKPGDRRIIWEAFLKGQEPDGTITILEGGGENSQISVMPETSTTDSQIQATTSGTGGLY